MYEGVRHIFEHRATIGRRGSRDLGCDSSDTNEPDTLSNNYLTNEWFNHYLVNRT